MSAPDSGPSPLPGDREGELESEIRFHVERRIEALMAEGYSRDEAEREAVRRFGDVEGVRMEMRRETRRRRRDDRVRSWFAGRAQDTGYAVRQWVRHPGFALVVVLTLALGIGANTAIFSVVDHVLLRPLPFPHPDRLAVLWTDVSQRGGPVDEWLSYSNFVDVRDEVPDIAEGALWGGFAPTLTGHGEPVAVQAAVVTQGMFSGVFQVEPAMGRTFTPEEDRPGGRNVALVSDGFWRNVLGAGPEVVGTTIVLNDVPYEIVGVMPAGFRPTFLPDAQVWTPAQFDPAAQLERRGDFNWRSVVRLAPEAGLDAARSSIATVAQRLEAEYPESNTGMAFTLHGLREDLVAPARTGLWVVMGSVVLLLLVACVNVANLLLARATARTGELSIRSALGANRARIVGQLTVESVGLALLGGAVGVALGIVGTRALVAVAPAGTPRIDTVSVDLRVLAATFAVAVAAGIAFGLVPALQVSKRDLQSSLREEGREGQGGRGGLRMRNALVVAQVALALVVLVGAGLLTRSFAQLRSVDMGFEPEGALTFFLNLPQSRYPDDAAIRPALRELETRLGALQGVDAVGTVSALPLAGFDSDVSFMVEGRVPPRPGEAQAAWIRRVTPGYADAMKLRVVAGRFIEPRDEADGARVTLINETLARAHFPDEDPLGARLDFGEPGGTTYEIVGVVADIRHFSIRDDQRDAVYLAYDQVPVRSTFMVVRAAEGRDPTALVPAIRGAVSSLDPSLAAQRIEPMPDIVAAALAPDRFLTTLLSLFAVVTLILAVVGLYGVIAVSVSARRRELGVRMALGAEAGRISGLVVRRAVTLAGVGVVVGMGLAALGAPLLRSLLYGTTVGDPVTFVAVAALLVAVAVAAAALPAWRATRVDPVRVLRSD